MFYSFITNTLIFFVEIMREAFALQKLLTFFQKKKKKNIGIFQILMFEILTHNIVCFEQLGPDMISIIYK